MPGEARTRNTETHCLNYTCPPGEPTRLSGAPEARIVEKSTGPSPIGDLTAISISYRPHVRLRWNPTTRGTAVAHRRYLAALLLDELGVTTWLVNLRTIHVLYMQ